MRKLLVVGLIYHNWLRRVRPIYRSMREDRSQVDGRVGETFGGIRVVRAFAREAREELNYAVGHHTAIRKDLWARAIQTTSPATRTTTFCGAPTPSSPRMQPHKSGVFMDGGMIR